MGVRSMGGQDGGIHRRSWGNVEVVFDTIGRKDFIKRRDVTCCMELIALECFIIDITGIVIERVKAIISIAAPAGGWTGCVNEVYNVGTREGKASCLSVVR